MELCYAAVADWLNGERLNGFTVPFHGLPSLVLSGDEHLPTAVCEYCSRALNRLAAA